MQILPINYSFSQMKVNDHKMPLKEKRFDKIANLMIKASEKICKARQILQLIEPMSIPNDLKKSKIGLKIHSNELY